MINKASSFTPLYVHPLFYITATSMLGIWWQACKNPLEIPLAVYVLIMAGMIILQKESRLLPMLMCSFFVAAAIYQKKENSFFEFYAKTAPTLFDAQGRVTSIDTLSAGKFKQIITFNMSVLKQKNATQWIPVNETIKIYVRKKSDLQEQDTIEIHNLIAKKPTNTHYLNYLIKEGITATIFPSSLTYTLLKRPNYSIQKAIRTLRTNTFNRCQSKCSEKCFLLFSSLFLGNNFFNKESIKKQQQTFQWWGISHHLARSGLHLVIFVFLISLLANCFYAPFFLKQFFIIMIILFYSFLSWPSISFLRALFTTGLYCTCNLLELPIDFLHLLTIVTLIVLITSPHQLFSLDFQLSFGLTYALAWLSNVQKSTKKRIP